MSEEKALELGLTPLAAVAAYSRGGVEPAIMGTGPIPASRKCLDKAGWAVADLDLIESNEAFAAQVLAVEKLLHRDAFSGLALPGDRLNPNGGAIALGHPVGATGARLILTTLHELKRRGAKRGLISLCIGGGQGGAAWLETL